jgi:hypothetical protein
LHENGIRWGWVSFEPFGGFPTKKNRDEIKKGVWNTKERIKFTQIKSQIHFLSFFGKKN